MNYDELVTAATVGLGQRPATVTDLPAPADVHVGVLGDDQTVALLDAAALLEAAERAGGFAPTGAVALPAPAPADDDPLLPPDAAGAVTSLLTGDLEVLADLLAAASGHRVPPAILPALLAAAVRAPAIRGPVRGVLGGRGRWLAEQSPAWHAVVDGSPAVGDDPEIWRTGRPAERRAWFAALRRDDPAAARDLLAESWSQETGDLRVELLGDLAAGISPDDEAFLDAALDDRKAAVRDRAVELLTGLPGSALGARAAERGRAALHVERRGLRRRLVPELPPEPDAASIRDGLSKAKASPGVGSGAGARRLTQVIAAVPIDRWSELLGADPPTLAGLDVTDGFRAEVHDGWRLAAVRDGSAEWARALLAASGPKVSTLVADDRLADLLPASERLGRALRALAAGTDPRSSGWQSDVLAVPAPWPDELTDAVLHRIAAQARAREPAWPDPSVQLLGRCVGLTRDRPGEFRALAELFRSRPAEARSAGGWAGLLDRAADTVDLRVRFHRSLQELR